MSEQPTEQWKPVTGYEGLYEVSNLGRVRTLYGRAKGTALKPQYDKHGYQRVGLYKDHKTRQRWIHTLVAREFIGPRPEGAVINHMNSVATDNRASNLEYTTTQGNITHAKLNGRMMHGEGHTSSILTVAAVLDIRARFAAGVRVGKLAREYGVTHGAIGAVTTRRTWAHVHEAPPVQCDADTASCCGSVATYHPPHPAEPQNNVPAWRGGETCECGETTNEKEPSDGK